MRNKAVVHRNPTYPSEARLRPRQGAPNVIFLIFLFYKYHFWTDVLPFPVLYIVGARAATRRAVEPIVAPVESILYPHVCRSQTITTTPKPEMFFAENSSEYGRSRHQPWWIHKLSAFRREACAHFVFWFGDSFANGYTGTMDGLLRVTHTVVSPRTSLSLSLSPETEHTLLSRTCAPLQVSAVVYLWLLPMK